MKRTTAILDTGVVVPWGGESRWAFGEPAWRWQLDGPGPGVAEPGAAGPWRTDLRRGLAAVLEGRRPGEPDTAAGTAVDYVLFTLTYEAACECHGWGRGVHHRALPALWCAGYKAAEVSRGEAIRRSLEAPPPAPENVLSCAVEQGTYERALGRILDHIARGDIYQANYTAPFAADFPCGRARALFEALAATAPAPFETYVDCGDWQVISNSPELLLAYDPVSRRAVSRPIKGTAPRGATKAADAAAAAALRASEKDRAEHVMIVDLVRNDLGRTAVAGSVRVETLMGVETFPTLHHMTSTITAALRPDCDTADLLLALLPGGSVTGAPKKRAVEILNGLEPFPRGLYCGAVGLREPGGRLTVMLPIRTAVVAGGKIHYHAGGGIVADSDPGKEWEEMWLKTRAFQRAVAMSRA